MKERLLSLAPALRKSFLIQTTIVVTLKAWFNSAPCDLYDLFEEVVYAHNMRRALPEYIASVNVMARNATRHDPDPYVFNAPDDDCIRVVSVQSTTVDADDAFSAVAKQIEVALKPPVNDLLTYRGKEQIAHLVRHSGAEISAFIINHSLYRDEVSRASEITCR